MSHRDYNLILSSYLLTSTTLSNCFYIICCWTSSLMYLSLNFAININNLLMLVSGIHLIKLQFSTLFFCTPVCVIHNHNFKLHNKILLLRLFPGSLYISSWWFVFCTSDFENEGVLSRRKTIHYNLVGQWLAIN